MLQSEAFQLLTMGKNIFLTGAAGSGKTYVLNQYINYLKENSVDVAITASTGLAATHLHGTTIHSWSGIGIRESLTPQDFIKLDSNKRVKRNFKKAKVLIIDEISMLHQYQLDLVDAVARHFLDSAKPFGGLQVVLCGDFFQLPPVSTASDSAEKHFAFQACIWGQADFHICYLHEQHRQGSDPLMTILNDIRSGTAGEHTRVPLRTRYKKEPEGFTKATKLYARNINVDVINSSELAKLSGEEHIFTMQEEGFSALIEGIKRSCLAPEQLILKIGAEVMFIKNDPQGNVLKSNSEQSCALLHSLSEQEKDDIRVTTLNKRFEARKSASDQSNSNKKNKSKPTPGYLITQEHLKEGFTLESLAESRELSVGTILKHLEQLKQLNLLTESQIDHLKHLIPNDTFELISSALLNSQDGKLKPIYEAFAGTYSYSMIQLVRLLACSI